MTAHIPRLPFTLDPLIAEAKRRMRRRRYFTALALVAAAAISTTLTLGLRPGQSPRGGVSASPTADVPKDRLIVPGLSVAGIRFGTPRRAVEKRLGPGKPVHRDLVSYMGGRLFVVYSFHDGYTGRVRGLVTKWPGFKTSSGVGVGSSQQTVRALHAGCANGYCGLGDIRHPDAPGTLFFMQDGKVAEILVGST